jgi:hypothetical protein
MTYNDKKGGEISNLRKDFSKRNMLSGIIKGIAGDDILK